MPRKPLKKTFNFHLRKKRSSQEIVQNTTNEDCRSSPRPETPPLRLPKRAAKVKCMQNLTKLVSEERSYNLNVLQERARLRALQRFTTEIQEQREHRLEKKKRRVALQINNLPAFKCAILQNDPTQESKTPYTCKCCLRKYKQLSHMKKMWQHYHKDEFLEVYGNILIECFALPWSRPANPEINLHLICEKCISRLKDAVNFKKEVLASEQLLLTRQLDVGFPGKIKKEHVDFDMQHELKTENLDDDDDDTKNIYKVSDGDAVQGDVCDKANGGAAVRDYDNIQNDNAVVDATSVFKDNSADFNDGPSDYPTYYNKAECEIKIENSEGIVEKIKQEYDDVDMHDDIKMKYIDNNNDNGDTVYKVCDDDAAQGADDNATACDNVYDVARDKIAIHDNNVCGNDISARLDDTIAPGHDTTVDNDNASNVDNYFKEAKYENKIKNTEEIVEKIKQDCDDMQLHIKTEYVEDNDVKGDSVYKVSDGDAARVNDNGNNSYHGDYFTKAECEIKFQNTKDESLTRIKDLEDCTSTQKNVASLALQQREQSGIVSKTRAVYNVTTVEKCPLVAAKEFKRSKMTGDEPCKKNKMNNKPKDFLKDILQYSNATPIKSYTDFGFLCIYCTQQFVSPHHLKHHTLDKHSEMLTINIEDDHIKLDITDLMCVDCYTDLNSLKHLQIHSKMEHNRLIRIMSEIPIVPFKFDAGPMKCTVCDTKFRTFEFLNQHMKEHFGYFKKLFYSCKSSGDV